MKNEYAYLLDYPQEKNDDLVETVYKITELIENDKIAENEKKNFYSVMKKIIRRSDFRSYSCVNLLRDIMIDEMFDFLLEELKKNVLTNEPLSIEIMKIITCDNFPEYYSFLDSAKDNMLISYNFRKLIFSVLDFNQGKLKCLSFPNLNRKSRDSTEIEIDWKYWWILG